MTRQQKYVLLVLEAERRNAEAESKAPSYLEKAEKMLFKMECGEVSEDRKCVYLINIAYNISNACATQLDVNHQLRKKYATLYEKAIPVTMYQLTGKVQEMMVSISELRKIQIRMQTERRISPAERAYFSYVFDLVLISLKEIFEEVKNAIIGE